MKYSTSYPIDLGGRFYLLPGQEGVRKWIDVSFITNKWLQPAIILEATVQPAYPAITLEGVAPSG